MSWKKAMCTCLSVTMMLSFMGSIVLAEESQIEGQLPIQQTAAEEAQNSLDSPAQQAAQQRLQQDLKQLYQDLETIPIYSGTGGVGILSDTAFAISAPEGMAGIGAARYGKGRMIVAGSTQYVNLQAGASETDRTIARNVLQWLTAEGYHNAGQGNSLTGRYEETLASQGKKKIQIMTTVDLNLDPTLPIEVVKIEKWEDQKLNPQKVAIAYVDAWASEADTAALERYMERGGNIILAQNGRSLESITRSTPVEERARIGNWRGARISEHFPIQRLLNKAGLSLMNREVPAQAAPPKLSAEAAANSTIRYWLKQGKALEDGTITLSELPIGLPGATDTKKKQLLTDLLLETLETITPENSLYAWTEAEVKQYGQVSFPIVRNEQPYRNALLNFAFSHFTLEPNQQPSPYASDFPGAVLSAAEKVINRMVEVNLDFPYDMNYSLRLPNKNWVSTGLYAPPGETITLQVPKGAEHVSVQIGSHDDDLRGSSTWNRVPLLVHFKKLSEGTVQVSSPYGGMIYFIPMKPTPGEKVNISISGAVQAAYYELGKTTQAEWDVMRSKPSAPIAELKSNRIVLNVPSSFIKDVANPEELMQTWDEIVHDSDRLSGQSLNAPLPHTADLYQRYYVVDRQITSGALHAGYPIMAPLGAGKDLVNVEYVKTKAWGYWHELGHEYQQSAWTWGDVGEVTVNIFSLFLQEKFGNPSELLKEKDGKTYYERAMEFLNSNDPSKRYGQIDNYDRLVLFKQLQLAYGWELYTDLFTTYREMPKTALPKNNQEQIDLFAVTASKLAQEDLTEFFTKWAVGLSDAGKAKIEALQLPDPKVQPWTLTE
ncbi:M60 family metallopeptidase [Paenibacillus sp. 1001270B_150601_E10]|uniref:M60 family metallopeptidase n=1 Tax=Paenibacillus sp. 1001270B_150601_E10 TaxID=2787079 RepID=UPI00189E3DC4|nr:M60 family metallopeptidase [Paenibacillus sp. 1001270B_150601_E10]